MTIWKFPIQITDRQQIVAPLGATPLCVQVQHGQPCLWMKVNPANTTSPITIEVFGTGHDMPQDMGVERHYIGTFQMNGGSLIFHVFERV